MLRICRSRPTCLTWWSPIRDSRRRPLAPPSPPPAPTDALTPSRQPETDRSTNYDTPVQYTLATLELVADSASSRLVTYLSHRRGRLQHPVHALKFHIQQTRRFSPLVSAARLLCPHRSIANAHVLCTHAICVSNSLAKTDNSHCVQTWFAQVWTHNRSAYSYDDQYRFKDAVSI